MKKIIPLILFIVSFLCYSHAKAETLFSQPNSDGYFYYEYAPFGYQGFIYTTDTGVVNKLTNLLGSNMPSYIANFSYPNGQIPKYPIATTTKPAYVSDIILNIRDSDKQENLDYYLNFRCLGFDGTYHGSFFSQPVNSSNFSTDSFTPVDFKFKGPNCDLSKYQIHWIVWANSPLTGGIGGSTIQTRVVHINSLPGYGVSNENNDIIEDYEAQITIKYEYVDSRDPVLIVPGVLGTEMKNNDDLLWINLKMINPFNNDNFMDPLSFKDTLSPVDDNLSIVDILRKKSFVGFDFDYSEGLLQEFTNQGYILEGQQGSNLFTFPYDWRYGVSGKYLNGSTTVDLLKEKIQQIIKLTGRDKVNVVAHSTGGLLVKKYVMENPVEHHIGKAVMVGVPNLGAPKAIKALLVGDNFGVNGLSDNEMKKISQNLPVVYDLMPSEKYYENAGSYYNLQQFGLNPFVGPQITELDFNEASNRLINKFSVNQTALNNAKLLHTSEFDSLDIRNNGVDVYSIVGCKSPTFSGASEIFRQSLLNSETSTFDFPQLTTGDGTVPLASAASIPTEPDKVFYALKYDHGKMLSSDGIRQKIVNILNNSNLPVGSSLKTQADYDQNSQLCKLKGHWFKIFSPLDIEVTDELGNRLGFAEDGSIENNIPGADFEVFGEHKYVFIPTGNSQQYSIKLKGTGQGIFTLKDSEIDGSVINTQIFPNIPVTTSLKGTLNLGVVTTLSLDVNGDGNFDKTILPSSLLNQEQSKDLIPPVSTSTLEGLMGRPGYFRSNVTVNISSVDPVIAGHEAETSGVLSINYSLDGQATSTYASSSPIAVTSEGKHTLSFYATDKAGNSEQIQTLNFTIDKTAPEFNIQFDPSLKDLKFSGQDSISTTSKVTVLDEDNKVTLTDEAGNISQLILKDKNRRKSMKAEIKSLSYNNQPVDVNKLVLHFEWQTDKNSKLKSLTQELKSKKDFNIQAEYENNKTKLEGKDRTGKIKQILPGLVLLKLTTKQGDFEWGW